MKFHDCDVFSTALLRKQCLVGPTELLCINITFGVCVVWMLTRPWMIFLLTVHRIMFVITIVDRNHTARIMPT